MPEPPSDHEVVFTTSHQKEFLDSRLVLDAVNIPSEEVYRNRRWYLVVHRDDLDYASAELEAYHRENPQRDDDDLSPAYAGATTGVIFYVIVMALFAIMTGPRGLGTDWFPVGRMHAEKVIAGEWWRTVTALTLHLDTGHLAGNIVFGTVFGLLAGQAFGGGMAWMIIVIAGSTGNYINAMIQAPTHTSVGASTAVFAALGVLVAHAFRPGARVHETWIKRWSPLIGGILLLAFIGVGGERTDVTAHVTGFFAGLVIGWGCSWLPKRWLASDAVQKTAGLIAVAIVAGAWGVGLTAGR
jgi:rhomboid protease GluP